jgi:2-dehydropantoate 2-reductase
MRYVVYGAGAVGGVVAAHLQLAGIATTVVARGEHLARIRAGGLVLDTQEGQEAVHLAATDTAAEVDWTDDTVVLLSVKSHQTAGALDDLEAHAPAGTVVVSAQNGVANEPAILRRFASTYAVCVMLPALHLEPGVVVQKSHPTPGILDVGRFPGPTGPSGADATAEAIAADLRTAGFASQARLDIMAWKYRKLLTNAVGDVSTLFAPADGSAELARGVAAEGDAVLAAAGIVAVTAEADDERRGELLRQRSDKDRFPGNSLAQSLARGLDTEIHYRVGELVLLGRLHGVPTPTCERVLRAALART